MSHAITDKELSCRYAEILPKKENQQTASLTLAGGWDEAERLGDSLKLDESQLRVGRLPFKFVTRCW